MRSGDLVGVFPLWPKHRKKSSPDRVRGRSFGARERKYFALISAAQRVGVDVTMQVWIGVLGPWDVRLAGQPVAIPRGQLRIFLASLLLALPDPVPVPVLIERGWPEHEPVNATSTLHTYATRLRKLLGPGLIETAAGGG